MARDATTVRTGPGTLYIAPLGSPEPSNATGPWPSAWTELGYTAEGSQFTFAQEFEDVEVAEELDPIRKTPGRRTTTVEFALAQTTAKNLSYALNGGGVVSTSGGETYFEPPDPGSEVYVMLGWDSEDGRERAVFRKAINTGDVTREHRKGADKAVLPVQFECVRPDPATPTFRYWNADE